MPRSKPAVLCCLGFAAALLLTLAPRAAVAASTEEALRPGAWAVEINKDASSGSAGIGILRHSSERTAFRLNFGFSYSGDGERGTDRTVPGSSIPYYNRYYSRSYDFVLNWVHYFSLSDGFAGQFGVGPAAYLSSSTSSQGSTSYRSSSQGRTSQYGVEANLGVEWFFSRRLSLGGRAGLYAVTGTRTTISTYTYGGPVETTNTNGTADNVRSEYGRIILTAYL